MERRLWARRAAILLAVSLPWLLLLVPKPTGRSGQLPDDGRERDLARVFAQLGDRWEYRELPNWCGLRVTTATPAEIDALAAALRKAEDDWVWGSDPELRDRVRESLANRPDGLRWVRVHHRTDPSQWIGIGWHEAMLFTGRPTSEVIFVRVPMGFKPSATVAGPKA